ncbi:N1221-domain-containing protein [Sodiomyces alkalinus F11]|uniref:N1221-domain-containing protein n=1 Tax=Sodiomyces alkalinus (strain CBS 110278 / VKM F-3762 / F11) TaxID=1314773 RepID=A0A3N2Q907_SODAK|nr:N1221-domain-containing protein [Sodiomyces alkalinus F11]ROT43177.1 N1221-domain-containing protein [Sodiomyces alkalinus F11]
MQSTSWISNNPEAPDESPTETACPPEADRAHLQTMNPWLSRPADEAPESASDQPDTEMTDAGEVADVGPEHEQVSDVTFPPPPPPPVSSRRPQLQGDQATPPVAPAPPAPMPPPPPSNPQQPTDSLSLVQLRRIVAEFNKVEPIAYDFVYEDLGPLEEEIDEWFVYQHAQWACLNAAQAAFQSQWELHQDQTSWDGASESTRQNFVRECLEGARGEDSAERLEAFKPLMYLVLGRWATTASPITAKGHDNAKTRSAASPGQLKAIKSAVSLLTSAGAVEVIWKTIQNCFEFLWSDDVQRAPNDVVQDAQEELYYLATILYIIIQVALDSKEDMESTHAELLRLNPALVNFLSLALVKVRWDEDKLLPMNQILLLLWKAILLQFGGTKEIEETKNALSETGNDLKPKDIITASPLDYHVFRQELTSKYPSYVPPQPVIPLEADNSTLLPPPPNQPPRSSAANGIIPTPPNMQSGGASILNQPVHIATPAPSPPPSPGLGGKGGKKQNYQTNQNFPFLYPPLDATSNSAGGKGGAGLQESLVGRKWEGSDIPASILEAGELFSKRVRMSRATRQMWDAREKFLKSERGWGEETSDDEDVESLDLSNIDLEKDLDLDLHGLTQEERELILEARGGNQHHGKRKDDKPDMHGPDYGPNPAGINEDVKRRLLAVESFYHELLPQLQSLAIVLLQPTFWTMSVLDQTMKSQPHAGMAGRGPNANSGLGITRLPQLQDPSSVGGGQQTTATATMSAEELDAARSREIMTKASTGTLLLLLKWLKLSHVLKFEYMTQLVLDHNGLILILKLFAHQDIQQVVDSKTDSLENSFFHFCNLRSESKEASSRSEPSDNVVADEDRAREEEEEESEDEAAPPPIKRKRSPPGPAVLDVHDVEPKPLEDQAPAARPEVDELGYPVNPLPAQPITDFSRRNFFSLINHLRIMQKICKRKAYRSLMLVQIKSSNILRKSLKVPQPELRLYTLKLFKNQVPYCGRKWRQSNMRVITAVYLHVRPELRDEWLAGSDVDAEVDSALPLEQALRSLTHWFNVRNYPDKMVSDDNLWTAYREEQGFFTRELEKLGMNWQDFGADGNGILPG